MPKLGDTCTVWEIDTYHHDQPKSHEMTFQRDEIFPERFCWRDERKIFQAHEDGTFHYCDDAFFTELEAQRAYAAQLVEQLNDITEKLSETYQRMSELYQGA